MNLFQALENGYNLLKTNNINSAIKKFKENDWWIIGLDQDANLELNNFILNYLPRKKLLFILGSEGKGINRLVKKNCDYLVKINMNQKSSNRMDNKFQRIESLPPYVFNVIADLRQQARRKGKDIIDLAMGNPDIQAIDS